MEDQKKAKVMFTEEPQQKRQKVVGFAPAAQSSPNRENKSVHANGGPSHEKTLEKKASENSQSSHAQSSLSQPPPPALNPHLLVDDDDDDYIRRFSCAAQSAIKLSLVNRVGTSGESFNVLDEFSPEFCHQFFGLEETIVGYEDLKINIKFCEASMRCFVDTTFKSSLSNVDGTNNAAPRDPGTEAMIPPVYELYSAGGLPPSPHVTTSQAEFRKWLADDYCPPGTLYLRQGTYEIFHGTSADPKIAALHSRVEPLAMHFIDGSSCVDTSDPRWESFYLYEVKNGGAMGSVPTASSTSVSASTKTYRLLGYVTCFRFDNPFRERRLALRLCQLLIIPSRQGRGLGRLLYNAVQSYVDSNPNVFELSLEDPVPTVVHIRNCCDLDRAFSSKLLMFERPEQWVERRASGGGNYNENTDSGKEKSKFENEKNDEKDQIHETKNPKDRTKLWNQRALMHAGSDSVWKETMGKETMEQTTTTSVVEPLRIDFHLLDGSTQSKKLLYEMRRLLRTTTKQCCFVYEVIKLWHLKKHFEGEHLQLALKGLNFFLIFFGGILFFDFYFSDYFS